MLPSEAFAPLFAQILLTFILLSVMFVRRQSDLANKAVTPKDISLGERNWSPRALQAADAFSNQFEMPILFYVLTILEFVTHHADNLFVILAWVFVGTRYLHALEHVTANKLSRRAGLFALGVAALMVMWGAFAYRILMGLP